MNIYIGFLGEAACEYALYSNKKEVFLSEQEAKQQIVKTSAKKDIIWLKKYIQYLEKENLSIIALYENDILHIMSEYYGKINEESEKIVLQYRLEFDTMNTIITNSKMQVFIKLEPELQGKTNTKEEREKILKKHLSDIQNFFPTTFCSGFDIEENKKSAACPELLFVEKTEEDFLEISSKIEQMKQDSKQIQLIFEGNESNLTAIKYRNYFENAPHIRLLELEWGRYKYQILEHSQQHYNAIRRLLKDKTLYPVEEFYHLIEDALQIPVCTKTAVNALDHVWGYFKNQATLQEKQLYLSRKSAYENADVDILEIKHCLWILTVKYKEPYLYDSYYFKDCYE